MDIFTMSQFLLYRASAQDEPPVRLRVHSMGIHEVMLPGMLHYPQQNSLLVMYFHTPAQAGSEPDCKGGFLFWPRGSLCRYGNPAAAWDHSWCVLEGGAANLVRELHGLPAGRVLKADAEPVFLRYFEAIMGELTSRQRQDEYVLEHLIDLLFYELSRLIRNPELQIPERLRRAEAFMWAGIARPLTLEEIAGEAALSVSRFSSLFRRYYGESPMQYLNRRRMDLAAQQLLYHAVSCKQIAEMTGFADQFHFSRRFRQFWGLSPREFRAEKMLRRSGDARETDAAPPLP